jgi:hypothetical protein
VTEGLHAADLLIEMHALLASPDPVLRDEVAYADGQQREPGGWNRVVLKVADLPRFIAELKKARTSLS